MLAVSSIKPDGELPVRSKSSCSSNRLDQPARPRSPGRHRPHRPLPERHLDPVFRARTVDLDSLPIPTMHIIDGHAVLPMAIMLEWPAEGAIHRNPGLVVSGVDDLRLFKGVILNQNRQASVEVRVGKAVRSDLNSSCPPSSRGSWTAGRRGRPWAGRRHPGRSIHDRLASSPRPRFSPTRTRRKRSIAASCSTAPRSRVSTGVSRALATSGSWQLGRDGTRARRVA